MWSWSFGLPTITALRDGTVGLAYYAIDRDGIPVVCVSARLALDPACMTNIYCRQSTRGRAA